MTIRVLVVDDHQSWRRHVSAAIQENLLCEVIGEAADGLEAVQKAERLRPNLIVLDIGLPTINGIVAARRILTSCPDVKILFLSLHQSPAVVQAALDTGAAGYVAKSDAAFELEPAIEAISRGEPFLSARFTGHGLKVTSPARAPQKSRHAVQLYSDESSLVDGFARFASAALAGGTTAIVATTRLHRPMLAERLQACDIDVDRAAEQGRYVWLDAAEVLSAITVNGWPDEARFREAAVRLVTAAESASPRRPARIGACGEVAPLLWREGRAAAAIRLERLWDEFADEYDVDLLCGYSLLTPLQDDDERIFRQICAEHSAVHR